MEISVADARSERPDWGAMYVVAHFSAKCLLGTRWTVLVMARCESSRAYLAP